MRINSSFKGLMFCGFIISATGLITQSPASDCTVHWDELQQHMSGFGGSTAWAGGLAENLINDLFSPTTGCGLTLVRMRIAPDGTTGAGEIAIAKKAQALGASIWAAPWSPPAAWKDNNSVNNGGSLLPSRYQDWADRLVSYVLNLQSQGIDLKWISAQNEPNWTATYESCRYTPEQIATFIGEYLGPSLEKAGLKTKIIAPEVINWGSLKPFGDAILNSTAALKYCSVIASHSYGDEPKSPNYPYKLIAEKGKELWETEYGFDQFAGDESMTPGIAIGKQMHNQIVQGPVSAYHTWWIIPADGVNGNASNGLVMRGHVIQRGYVMGNYSRFVRPGSYRVTADHNPSPGIWVTAYRNDSLGQLVIVAINENTSAKEQKFILNGISVPDITPWETSEDVKLTARAQITADTSFSWTLPAKSVISFVGSYKAGHHLTVETTGLGSVNRSPKSASYEKGTVVSLTAVPQTGWVFKSWTGSDVNGNQNPLTITMDTNKTITALFNRATTADSNMVLNGDFSSGSDEWTLNVWGGSASGSVINGEYQFSIASVATNNHSIQLVQPGLFLENGQTYLVTFDAYAASNRTMEVNVEMTDDPWTSYLQELQQFDLSTTKQQFSFKFTMEGPTDVNGRIGFNVGTETSAVTIDNISVKIFDPTEVSPIGAPARLSSAIKVHCSNSALRIELTAPANNQKLSFELYNLQGDVVGSATLQTRTRETNSHTFDLAGVSKGFYIVKVNSGKNNIYISKLLITK